jgi:hypothetical protein
MSVIVAMVSGRTIEVPFQEDRLLAWLGEINADSEPRMSIVAIERKIRQTCASSELDIITFLSEDGCEVKEPVAEGVLLTMVLCRK